MARQASRGSQAMLVGCAGEKDRLASFFFSFLPRCAAWRPTSEGGGQQGCFYVLATYAKGGEGRMSASGTALREARAHRKLVASDWPASSHELEVERTSEFPKGHGKQRDRAAGAFSRGPHSPLLSARFPNAKGATQRTTLCV